MLGRVDSQLKVMIKLSTITLADRKISLISMVLYTALMDLILKQQQHRLNIRFDLYWLDMCMFNLSWDLGLSFLLATVLGVACLGINSG